MSWLQPTALWPCARKEDGLATAWIDRRAGHGGGATAPPQEEVAPDLRFTSMAELVARHRAEGG